MIGYDINTGAAVEIGPPHPIAALFPKLEDDELRELAGDIGENGLLDPVVLDRERQILDGINRVAACELAEIDPEIVWYDGEDPAGYVISKNITRRHLTKGQRAILVEMARVKSTNPEPASAAFAGTGLESYQSRASTVRQFAPALVSAVVGGSMPLDKAYDEARKVKEEADSIDARMARLRADRPDLADKVVEGELTIAEAQAARQAAIEEQRRQARVATELLGDILVPLAGLAGTAATEVARYDVKYAASSSRWVTDTVIERARMALDEIEQAWKDRSDG